MILRNLYSITDNKVIDISIADGKIQPDAEMSDGVTIHFNDVIVFPGLINSHDHLDFNLFPRLGNRVYKNYVEWSHDIQQANKAEIDKVLKIPKPLRIKWGVYKNLLCGVTTVVNHGATLEVENDLIHVFQDCYSLHSIQLEPHWKRRLLKPFRKDWPFAIHIGEGTDEAASNEINTLIKWNLLRRKLIGIHGVAMNEQQARAFEALVWCPDSNYFLVGRTADITRLKNNTTILFGTDSTLSANWNIWEQLRLARAEGALDDTELFASLTTNAGVWGIKNKGKLEVGYDADLVIARRKENDDMDTFYSLSPEDILLVIYNGEIKLFDTSVKEQLGMDEAKARQFYKVSINGSDKYVLGDLPGLIQEIRKYNPETEFPII
ncbi:MAG: amidohydrolase family protein [Flavipsychrobacter sp.]